jgi:hypothetical protein
MVRVLGDEIPGPTDGNSVGEKVGILVDSKVVECVEKRSPLSNSPGVEVSRPLRQKVRPIEKAREARARRERQSKLLEARQPTATFELENPPDPPQFLEELTPSAGQTKSAKVFVSPGLGKNQSAMSHLRVDVLTTHSLLSDDVGIRFKTVDAALNAPEYKTYAEASDSARRLMERDAVIANVFRKNKTKVGPYTYV